MKRLLTLVISITFLCACKTQKPEMPFKDAIQLLMEEEFPGTTELTIEQLDKADILFDSVYARINYETDLSNIVGVKGFAMGVFNSIMARGVSDINRLEGMIEKVEKIQFEFFVEENEEAFTFDLPNVFAPKKHDEIEYDCFYFLMDLEKTTKKCSKMLCYLPNCFRDLKKKPILNMLLVKGLDTEDMSTVEPLSIESNNYYWVAEFDKKTIDIILDYDRIIFQAYYPDDVENMETSLLNLKWLKEQYASVVGASITTEQ